MSWFNRFSNLFRRENVDEELDEELQFHLDARIRDNLKAGMNAEAARLAHELRHSNKDLVVDLGDDTFRLKKSFEAADKLKSRYILIVGEDEVKADAFALKNQGSGEQVTVPRAELAQRIAQH